MKAISYLFLFVLLMPSSSFSQESFDLKIKVENIENLKGVLRICLGNKKKDFLRKCHQSQSAEVNQKEMYVILKNIPPGKYVVQVYHDEDKNGQLNRSGLFGSPSEGYGFSNNPKSFIGPPKFKKCLFQINADTEINIKLRN